MGFLIGYVAVLLVLGLLSHAPGRRPYLSLLFWFGLVPFACMWGLRLTGWTTWKGDIWFLLTGFLLLPLLGALTNREWLSYGGATLVTTWMVWLYASSFHAAPLGLVLPQPPVEAPPTPDFTVGVPVTCQGVALEETRAALDTRLGAGRELSSDRPVLARYTRVEYPNGVWVLFDADGLAAIVRGRSLEQGGQMMHQVGALKPRVFVPPEVELAEQAGKTTRCYLVRGRLKAALIEPQEQSLSVDGVKLEATRAEVEASRRAVEVKRQAAWEVRVYPGSLVVIYKDDRVYGVRGRTLKSGDTVLGEGGEKPGYYVVGSAYTQAAQAVAVAASEKDGFSLRLPGYGQELSSLLRQDVRER